jgi:hypothetical protein
MWELSMKKYFCCLLAALLLPIGIVCRSSALPLPDGYSAYLLSCSGQVIQLKLNNGQFKLTAKPLSLIRPIDHRFDGCLIGNGQLSSASEMFYAVLPQEMWLAASGGRSYKVEAFDLPTWKTIWTVKLPSPALDQPILLLDHARRRLIVNYQTIAGNPETASIYLQAQNDTTAATNPTVRVLSSSLFVFDTTKPFFNDQDQLVNGQDILSSEGTVRETVDGYDLLKGQSARFQSIARIGVKGNSYLDITFADAGHQEWRSLYVGMPRHLTQ